MTTRQRLELRLSQVRQRLNEIAGLTAEDFTSEVREEAEGLEAEYSRLEVQHRAAIISEGEEERAAAGLFPDGSNDSEGAELRQLMGRVSLGDYVAPALAGVGLSGAASELADALEVPKHGKGGGVAVPWSVLEDRAFTTTSANDGPESQRPILQRLFGPGVLDMLGVRVDSVPVGRTEWPILTSGVAPDQATEGTAAAAVTAGFSFANLKPKRLTGRYELTHEMMASVPAIEQALRRDLADAVRSKMSDIVINGATPDNTNPARIRGLISQLGAVSTALTGIAADYGKLHSLAVDGIHAQTEQQVRSVIGTETYQAAAGILLSGTSDAAVELFMRRSGGCIASTYIPAAVSNVQSALLHAAGPNGGAMRGDSVAAMWPTLEIIRDIYSQASQGITLTWVGLWDARVALRSGAYKHVSLAFA